MSFLEDQIKLHIDAMSELANIKTHRNTLQKMSPGNPLEEAYRGNVMQSQVNYADIMRKLTEKYIPFEMQLPNAIAVANFEMAEDAG